MSDNGEKQMDLEENAPVATQDGPSGFESVVEAGATNGSVEENGTASDGERDESGSRTGRGRGRENRNGRGSRRGRENRPRDYVEEGLEPRPDVGPALIVAELETMPEEQLHELAREYEIQGYTRIKRPDLIIRLLAGSHRT